MTKYCSECGEELPTPTSRYCSECGAKQKPTQDISTTVGRDLVNSTLVTANNVHMDKREVVECPDCFGTGIKHVDCPNCSGTGLIKELIPREWTDQQKKTYDNGLKLATSANKDSSLKDKATSTAAGLMLIAALFADADKEKKYAADDRNYRQINCPICEGKKYIPINHEENLKFKKIYDIPACNTCNGTKKIYLSD